MGSTFTCYLWMVTRTCIYMDKATTSIEKHKIYVTNEWSHVNTWIQLYWDFTVHIYKCIYYIMYNYIFISYTGIFLLNARIIYPHTFICQILTWMRDVGTLCYVTPIATYPVLWIYLPCLSILVLFYFCFRIIRCASQSEANDYWLSLL